MITDFRHSGIVVEDLDAALDFYVDLGFKVVTRMEESGPFIENILQLKGVKVTTVKLVGCDGNKIELLFFKSHPGDKKKRELTDYGLTHLAFTVDNVDEEYKRLLEKNIYFFSEPSINPEETAKVVFFRDPWGNILELVQMF